MSSSSKTRGRPFVETWTDEEKRCLVCDWKRGRSAGQIGKKLGKSRNAVMGKINRMGLQRGASNNPCGRYSLTEVNRKIFYVRELRERGMYARQIAESLGMTPGAVGSFCCRHNIKKYQKTP